MKLFYFLLLLTFAPILVFSQEFKESTLIKLNKNLKNASDVHQKIDALLKIGDYQIEREFNTAESFFKQAEKLIDSCNDNHENDLAFMFTKLGS